MTNAIKYHAIFITEEMVGTVNKQDNIGLYSKLRETRKETRLEQCNCAKNNCGYMATTVIKVLLYGPTITKDLTRRPGTESIEVEFCSGVGLVPLCNNCSSMRGLKSSTKTLDVNGVDIVYLSESTQ